MPVVLFSPRVSYNESECLKFSILSSNWNRLARERLTIIFNILLPNWKTTNLVAEKEEAAPSGTKPELESYNLMTLLDSKAWFGSAPHEEFYLQGGAEKIAAFLKNRHFSTCPHWKSRVWLFNSFLFLLLTMSSMAENISAFFFFYLNILRALHNAWHLITISIYIELMLLNDTPFSLQSPGISSLNL